MRYQKCDPCNLAVDTVREEKTTCPKCSRSLQVSEECQRLKELEQSSN